METSSKLRLKITVETDTKYGLKLKYLLLVPNRFLGTYN